MIAQLLFKLNNKTEFSFDNSISYSFSLVLPEGSQHKMYGSFKLRVYDPKIQAQLELGDVYHIDILESFK